MQRKSVWRPGSGNIMLIAGRTLGLLSCLLALPLQAVDNRTVTVTLNILAGVPCTIDVSRVNPLNLGQIVTTQVNGNYRKTLIPYTLTCSTATNLKMTILTNAAATWYGAGTLVTGGINSQDLGIQLLKENGTPVVFNEAIAFNSVSPPALFAVPVKRAGAVLNAASFYSASATMRVEYP
ncbi:MAG: fimbrial protein [Chania sp.]